MNVLWAGNEDIDFLTLGSAAIVTTGTFLRSGWSRNSIYMNANTNVLARTFPFSGGAVTSAWLSCRLYPVSLAGYTGPGLFGFGLSGTNSFIGMDWLGQIFTWNGASKTVLATPGATLLVAGVMCKVDMQVSNYGATSTINIYVNGSLMTSFSGNSSIAGMANFDSIFISYNPYSGGGPGTFYLSEFIVADSDTRALLGLNTLALTGAGTTNNWTNNTYTNINGVNYSDANPTYVNATAQDQEYQVGTVQPTVCSVVAVVISARMAASAASTPTHVKLGYGSAGTGYFGTGAQKTPTVSFTDYQQIDATNPITSAAWTQANLTAPLQLDLQSA